MAIEGMDVSYWQGDIDWVKAASRINFAYIRAGYGNDYIDPRMVEYTKGCADNSIPFGLYWYLKPGKDWRKHADNFAQFSTYGDLPPVMDVEETGGLAKTELESWIYKFALRYEEAAGRDLMIYTSPGFWNGNLPKTNWAKNRRLWVAHWTTAAAPTLPYEWTDINQPRTWTFWQYSAGGNNQGANYGVSSDDIDLNRFNGDREAFKAAFGVYPHETGEPVPPPVEPPPATYPEYVRTTALWLTLRQSPQVLADNKSGYLPLNTQLKIEGAQGDWYKITGWVHKGYTKAE